MAALVFRCPITRLNVHGWIVEGVDDDEAAQAVKCLACTRMHLVDPKTRRVLGYGDPD
jgi:hypothetical protein